MGWVLTAKRPAGLRFASRERRTANPRKRIFHQLEDKHVERTQTLKSERHVRPAAPTENPTRPLPLFHTATR